MTKNATTQALVKALGHELAWARNRAGMTLVEAAAATRISKTTLHAYEKGTTSPNMGALFTLAKVYGVPMSEMSARAERAVGFPAPQNADRALPTAEAVEG